MIHTVTTFLLLASVAEAQIPSRMARHHDALTGNSQRIPDQFIKGNLRDNFVIRDPSQHHDALTGLGPSLPDQFVKGHVRRDDFVLKPQAQHHDALTGLGSSIPGQFIKGDIHLLDDTSDPVSPEFVKDYSLKENTNSDIAFPSILDPIPDEETAFCRISGDRCSQYILESEWIKLGATAISGFQPGTCWEHGFSVNEGSKEMSMPLIGKTNVRFFKKAPVMELFTQTSPHVISALALALISLVGVSVTIFARRRVRRGTFMADKKPLLASWNL